MIVALDGTILLMAQPSLQRDLDASVAQIQWMSTGYLVAVAASLVIAGRLGDRYGQPRLLLVGVLGFGAASAGIALVSAVEGVITLRAVPGGFGVTGKRWCEVIGVSQDEPNNHRVRAGAASERRGA